MSFTQLNKDLQALKNIEHYKKDCELFASRLPKNKLNLRLHKANHFNIADMQAKILFEMLRVGITADEIVANRKSESTLKIERIITNPAPRPTADLKKEKYPNIAWDNVEDFDVLLCMGLFNDAISCHDKLENAQKKRDRDPQKHIPIIVEMDQRNRICYAELDSYNETKKFLGEHPLLKLRKKFSDLVDQKENDTDGFMVRQKNVQDSIDRYNNLIKSKKYKDDEEKNNWQALLDDYKNELEMIKKIIKKGKDADFFKIVK